VAQNDATVKGSGSHDKTGRHCLANDPAGKLNIAQHAGYWLRDPKGKPTKLSHICWDGCMFPNEVMMKPETWNDILASMIAVRDAHGWADTKKEKPAARGATLRISSRRGSALFKKAATKKPKAKKAKAKRPAKKKIVAKKAKKKVAKKPVRKIRRK
jgi:hypothetical protein